MIERQIEIVTPHGRMNTPQEMIDQLKAELAANGGNAEVEMYPGTAHGFAFPSRPAYDKQAAERHWERLFTLFGASLK